MTQSGSITARAQGNLSKPSRETWLALYQAASRLHALRPWDYLDTEDLFAVIDPCSKVTGFCYALGWDGIEYGLHVYPGIEAMETHVLLATGLIGPEDLLMEVRTIAVDYGPKNLLEKWEKDLISDLAYRPARGAWPQFRSYVPGYLPWALTAEEADFLLLCMEQTHAVVEEVRKDETLSVYDDVEGRILTRSAGNAEGESHWTTDRRPLEFAPEETPPDWQPDAEIFSRFKGLPTGLDAHWQIDFPMFPGSIGDTTPPRLTRYLLCVDENGLILPVDSEQQILIRTLPEMCNTLVSMLASQPVKPVSIQLQDVDLHAMLDSVLREAGVRVELELELPLIEHALAGLEQYMRAEKF